jgi:hypothetical protein
MRAAVARDLAKTYSLMKERTAAQNSCGRSYITMWPALGIIASREFRIRDLNSPA